MTMNPYQPPVMDHDLPSAYAGGDFDIGTTLTQAWRITKDNIGLWLGVSIVGVLVAVFATLTIVGYFIVVPVLAWGGTKFLLNLHDGRGDFNDLFSGFSNFGTVLGRMLLFGVIMITATLVAEGPMLAGQFLKNTPLMLIGYVIYFAFLFLVLFRIYFAVFFIVDRDMPAIEAISASWEITRGKTLKLAGLYVVSVIVVMAGLFAFCIGVFFTSMMAYVMYASAYRQLTATRPQPVPMPAPGWGY